MPIRRKRPKRLREKDRPASIALLAILEVIIAVFLLLASFAVSALSGLGYINIALGALFGLGGFVLFVFCLLFLGGAYGLWKGSAWGWWLAMMLAAFSMLSIVFLNVVGFVLGVLVAYLLTRPNAKKWSRV